MKKYLLMLGNNWGLVESSTKPEVGKPFTVTSANLKRNVKGSLPCREYKVMEELPLVEISKNNYRVDGIYIVSG